MLAGGGDWLVEEHEADFASEFSREGLFKVLESG